MDILDRIESHTPESEKHEYKHKRAENIDVVKELVALANTGGGQLVLGIHEDEGEIVEIQNIPDFAEREESIQQIIASHVDPRLSVTVEPLDVEGQQLLGFDIEHAGVLHTFRPGNDKPCIPNRQGTTTIYMSGSQVREFYRGRFATSGPEATKDELAEWEDEVWKQVHRIIYIYGKSDFEELEDRQRFAQVVKEVCNDLETRLEMPPQPLDDDLRNRVQNLVNEGQKLINLSTFPTVNISLGELAGGDIHRRPNKPKYIGKNLEEVKGDFDDQSETVFRKAQAVHAFVDG